MKKIIKPIFTLSFVIVLMIMINVAANFSSTTTGNTAQTVNSGRSYADWVNIYNPSGDTIYVMLYDLPTTSIATYTNTPRLSPIQCYPHSVILFNIPKSPSPMFSNAMQVRTVKRGVTTNTVNPALYQIYNSTVTPTYSPDIKINHYSY